MTSHDDETFARQLLTLIRDAGDDGMEVRELVARTGRSEDDIEDMLERLRASGYTRGTTRQRTEH
jgi:hypothetical protein